MRNVKKERLKRMWAKQGCLARCEREGEGEGMVLVLAGSSSVSFSHLPSISLALVLCIIVLLTPEEQYDGCRCAS